MVAVVVAMYWKFDGVAPESVELRRRLSCVVGLLVRSRVMVGKGADAEMVGTAPCGLVVARCRNCGGVCTERPISVDVVEPERSMHAAAEVVDAIAAAAGAKGWLCVPSYVVMSIDVSSAHLCTCTLIMSQIVRKSPQIESQ